MKFVLFDLDGTLLDSQLGITRCFNHALEQIGCEPQTEEQLAKFIGPPLEVAFAELLETDDPSRIAGGVEAYRSRYSEIGILECELYEGARQLLETLDAEQRRMYIATTKPEPYAKQIVDHFSVDDLFVSINGATFDRQRLDKYDVMRHVVAKEKVVSSEAVMIGDRKTDILAAKEHGIVTIAVLWGYGSETELTECRPDHLVSSFSELAAILV